MKCNNCGSEVPETAKVCGHCGHRLKTEILPVVQPTSIRQGLPGWVWGLGGGLVVVFAGIAIFAVMQLLGSNAPAALPSPTLLPANTSTPAPSSTPVPPTNTPLPTSTPEPEWVTVYKNETAGADIRDAKQLSDALIGTIEGVYRVYFEYRWSNKQGKICPPGRENFELWDRLDSVDGVKDNFKINFFREGTYELYKQLNGIDISEDGKVSSIPGSSSGSVEFIAVQDEVTVRVNNQDLLSFEFPVSNRQHNLFLLLSGPTDLCTDFATPSLSNLQIQVLR